MRHDSGDQRIVVLARIREVDRRLVKLSRALRRRNSTRDSQVEGASKTLRAFRDDPFQKVRVLFVDGALLVS